jgi:recombination protein RecA
MKKTKTIQPEKKSETNSLEEITKYLKSALKNADVMVGSDPSLSIQRISTGIRQFDDILGGGLPKGRITIFHGEESSGKSLLSYLCIAAAQRQGLVPGLVDVEHSFDPVWAQVLGIDTSKLIIVTTYTGEDALSAAEEMVKAGVGMVVLDSIAALLPTAEDESAMGDQSIGLQPRMLNKGLRRITQSANKNGTVMLLINQVRDTIGRFPGLSGVTMPGGRAQKHHASINVNISRGPSIKETVKDKDIKIGYIIRMTTVKNKTFHPVLTCELPFLFNGKLDLEKMVALRAIELGVIKNSKGYTYEYPAFPDGRLLGKKGCIDFITEHPEVYEELAKLVEEAENNDN